ncbi:MAG: alpha/beta hydrolase [Oscillospiraceae bacterium]|nr:alpha/beta hydrolase [Oscillospiraceae bacterium]
MKLQLTAYEHSELIPVGTLQTFETEMIPYPDHRRRTIRVWLPEDYDGVKRFPVVYLHDGQGVFQNGDGGFKLNADRALASLRQEGISAIVVAIDTGEDRGAELTPPIRRGEPGKVVNGFKIPLIPEPSSTDIYAQFVVEHLKPMIDENFMTLPDCANTCVGGISAGGSASYYMILKYPQVFGRAIICSPGFPMFDLDNMLRELDEYDMDALKDHRLAFYNGDQGIDVTSIDYVIAVYKKLKERGLTRRELMFILDTRQTHSEAAWGKYLPEFLRFLLAEDNSEPGN